MAIKDTCSKCDKPNDRRHIGQRYCKSCHAEYSRENRPKYSELTEEHKMKDNCRSMSGSPIVVPVIIYQQAPMICDSCGWLPKS